MLKCIGYRFKSFHGEINGKQIDSDKLLFSYMSDEEEGLNGWESHQLSINANRVESVFGVKIAFDQMGNIIAPELDAFIKQPILISCSFDNKNKATISRVFIDPSVHEKKS
jgi:hypothetical protein